MAAIIFSYVYALPLCLSHYPLLLCLTEIINVAFSRAVQHLRPNSLPLTVRSDDLEVRLVLWVFFPFSWRLIVRESNGCVRTPVSLICLPVLWVSVRRKL